jgi:23S rRNA pseudouridine1911/1915/1917 synthase
MRLDRYLQKKYPVRSRSVIQKIIREGKVKVNGVTLRKPSASIRDESSLEVQLPEPVSSISQPEPIPLDILYEDRDVIVICKPAGMVVHPAAGHASGTLVNAILNHCKDLSGIGGELRPGIVHRLDKDTSGVILIAKNNKTHEKLSRLFQERKIKKTYLALVKGVPKSKKGRIEKYRISYYWRDDCF